MPNSSFNIITYIDHLKNSSVNLPSILPMYSCHINFELICEIFYFRVNCTYITMFCRDTVVKPMHSIFWPRCQRFASVWSVVVADNLALYVSYYFATIFNAYPYFVSRI